MNKLHAVLLGIAMTVPLALSGCTQESIDAVNSIEVVSVKLEDWKNPEDGKTYVVALPTWKNNGKDAVKQVTFTGGIEGIDATAPAPKEPQFYGQTVEPGTTVTPDKVPQEGVVLGVKEDLEKDGKPVDPAKVKLMGVPSDKDFVPEKQSPA